MDYDLFSRLFKYKENASNSPLENYLTEQFAYILEYLVEQKSEIIGDLFKLFDIPVKNKNLLKIHIKTQWGTWVKRYNHLARPDIKIIVDKSVYFIEAKGVKFNGDKDYFGFDIAYGGTRVLWIGCFNTETNKSEKDFIVITSYADEQELLNQLKSKQFDRADNDGYLIYAKLYVHDILQKETFEEQKEIFDNWLKENYVADILSKSWDIISQ